MVGLKRHWNRFLNWLIPNRRKNFLTKMMQNDEELDLYFTLSKDDYDLMMKKIESDPKPNQELKNATKKYKNE